MNFSDQVKLIRRSKQLNTAWYRETYPEVADLAMDPAEHYLRYGASMGRNPGKNFDTRFYAETHPDVAESGLNPLVHFALHGRERGYPCRPAKTRGREQINVIRTKLLSLGFTERPLQELNDLLATSPDPETRALAARELALWHMREKSEPGYRTALDFIARARIDATDLDFRSKLTTAELLCHYHLGATEAGQACYERAALDGEVTPDVTLAWVNFQPTPEARIAWINTMLERYGIEPVTLLPGDTLPPYDRLTCAVDLPKVTDGPRVTVLIAAYDAAEMLPTALRSLQEQTWQNVEIIVLDDCSPTLETVEVAQRFAAADPRIRVIRMPENGGAYVARNRGLEEATGEFVTLHDADDWSHPRKIETQVRFLMDNPEVLGCMSQQARACSDLGFARWTGECVYTIPNTSSFMFRASPIRENIGYWDTVRFSGDNELVRRIRSVFGKESVNYLETGPMSFQRDSDSSIVADEFLGINGFLFGARRVYSDLQDYNRRKSKNLKFSKVPFDKRPFPAPAIMRCDRASFIEKNNHYPVIIASDLRMPGGSTVSCIQEITSHKKNGTKTGVFEIFRYDLFAPGVKVNMLDDVHAQIDGDLVQILSYGEAVSCDLLLLRYPPVLQHRQRYVPKIHAKEVKVIVNQPPMSDYGPEGLVRYELDKCAENIRHYFGKDAIWHPIGPLVREALMTHHAEQLHHINLSDQDWHNIIDIEGWDRGPRKRGPKDRLRIGRHSRDHAHKWPDTAGDILAAYPEQNDVEVHVLGGAVTPAQILGRTPDNWVVHSFGSLHPREFLRDIDVWIYFANPHWVESFGRTVIEAMAVGVPVILPEIYRPLFKDAALYATLESAVDLARKLHADPVAYNSRVELAKTYARENFSYKMHIERLRSSGVRV